MPLAVAARESCLLLLWCLCPWLLKYNWFWYWGLLSDCPVTLPLLFLPIVARPLWEFALENVVAADGLLGRDLCELFLMPVKVGQLIKLIGIVSTVSAVCFLAPVGVCPGEMLLLCWVARYSKKLKSALPLAGQSANPGCLLMPTNPAGHLVQKRLVASAWCCFAKCLLVGRLPRLIICNAQSCQLSCGFCSLGCFDQIVLTMQVGPSDARWTTMFASMGCLICRPRRSFAGSFPRRGAKFPLAADTGKVLQPVELWDANIVADNQDRQHLGTIQQEKSKGKALHHTLQTSGEGTSISKGQLAWLHTILHNAVRRVTATYPSTASHYSVSAAHFQGRNHLWKPADNKNCIWPNLRTASDSSYNLKNMESTPSIMPGFGRAAQNLTHTQQNPSTNLASDKTNTGQIPDQPRDSKLVQNQQLHPQTCP
ncbi:hypothetical protein Nepgr_021087 [Nepenthes gracilis]|uniref:Uncharacterized protein n=1 Tax=Nepenthes gracilis TaxID=150966 RepID=A0AAD3XX07_NEPGR|nr:hypothetical protein Nepgr_021087 [Nepenthes gracilis]